MDNVPEEVCLLKGETALNKNRSHMYHVMLLYHRADHDWVFRLAQKLQSPSIGLQCFCQDGDFDQSGTVVENLIQAFTYSRKTILVLSRIFMTETWPACYDRMSAILESNSVKHERLIVVAIDDFQIPNILLGLPCIVKTERHEWYKTLLLHLEIDAPGQSRIDERDDKTESPDGACVHSTDQTNLNDNRDTNRQCSVSVIAVQSSLYNGYLLCSVKSRCGWCGKEYVDIKEVPPDLASHGIQISEEEYRSALNHLFSDGHFTCYLWCYNLPFTVIFFATLLGLCLTVIPILDRWAGLFGHQTGVEFVLGTVAWMCALTVYLIMVYLTRRKLKLKTHRRLSRVNAILMKCHLLAGLEQLGVSDCNKYYIHFFYYDLGPCLAYLQELLMNTECSRTTIYMNNSTDLPFSAEADVDSHFSNSDTVQMQPTSSPTNTAVQLQTEKVLLNHSGEYINLLMRKKLDRPETDRHMNRHPCLCQFVEHKIYKLMTDV